MMQGVGHHTCRGTSDGGVKLLSVVDCQLFSSANRHRKVRVAKLMQASTDTKPPCDCLLPMFFLVQLVTRLAQEVSVRSVR